MSRSALLASFLVYNFLICSNAKSWNSEAEPGWWTLNSNLQFLSAALPTGTALSNVPNHESAHKLRCSSLDSHCLCSKPTEDCWAGRNKISNICRLNSKHPAILRWSFIVMSKRSTPSLNYTKVYTNSKTTFINEIKKISTLKLMVIKQKGKTQLDSGFRSNLHESETCKLSLGRAGTLPALHLFHPHFTLSGGLFAGLRWGLTI